MTHGRFSRRIEQVEMHRMPGKRLQGQRGDEFAPRPRHDYANLSALVAQPAYQFGTFVGSDPTADTEENAFMVQPLHEACLVVQICDMGPLVRNPLPIKLAKIAQRPDTEQGAHSTKEW